MKFLNNFWMKKKKKGFQDDVIEYYNNDACPFAQRSWLVILEKNIKVNYHLVDVHNKSDDFLAVNPKGEVPAASHRGKNLSESEELCMYLDQTFPHNPLTPSDPYDHWRMTVLFKKYGQIVPKYYALLKEQDPNKQNEIKTSLDTLFREMNGDIKGPYFLGEQFTLLDILLLPHFEKIEVVCGHYRNYKIPSNCENVKSWSKNCYSRESFKTTAARRTNESMMKIPYRERERNDYLIECYASYAHNKVNEIKKALDGAKAPLSKTDWEAVLNG